MDLGRSARLARENRGRRRTATDRPLAPRARLRGRPLRRGGRDREGHHRPARGAERVPSADGVRALDAFTLRATTPRSASSSSPAPGRKRSARGRPAGARRGRVRGRARVPRLNVLDLQRLIRVIPKPVIAMVAGYAVGGGHVLHVVCDLTIAAENAVFGQTGPMVGSFRRWLRLRLLARTVGQKRARRSGISAAATRRARRSRWVS